MYLLAQCKWIKLGFWGFGVLGFWGGGAVQLGADPVSLHGDLWAGEEPGLDDGEREAAQAVPARLGAAAVGVAQLHTNFAAGVGGPEHQVGVGADPRWRSQIARARPAS